MYGAYEYLWMMIIFSFGGWCVESALVSFQQKKWVNRGFLTGPVCPIYGYTMVIIDLVLRPFASNLIVLLVMGGLIAAVVEYFVGWLLERMFNQKWWDYSDHKFNLHGRIAFPETLCWGPLAALAVRYVVPFLAQKIWLVPRTVGWLIVAAIFAVSLVDMTIILYKMNKFERLTRSLKKRAEEMREHAELLRHSTETLVAKSKENAGALREALEDSFEFIKEEQLVKLRRLGKRLSGAYPKLYERWRALLERGDK